MNQAYVNVFICLAKDEQNSLYRSKVTNWLAIKGGNGQLRGLAIMGVHGKSW